MIGHNYNTDELYIHVATWALGTTPTDFDNLRITVQRPTQQIVGKRQYELSNHLGNVLATISDRKI